MDRDSLEKGAIKHLEDALESEDNKNFHIRAALQLLVSDAGLDGKGGNKKE